MNHLFYRDVWPHLERTIWPGAALASTEQCICPSCKTLDRGAAIDGLIEMPDGVVQPFAARIQPDDGWRTFTIRDALDNGRPTEWAKLQRPDSIRSYWHIHAYMPSDRGPGAIGVIETAALVHAIAAGKGERKRNGQDRNTFRAVEWVDLGPLLTVVRFTDRAVAS